MKPYEKFISDNLKFLERLNVEFDNLDKPSKQWAGELVLVFNEMIMITFAAYLYRTENLKNKCLNTKPKHISNKVMLDLERYLEVFRQNSDEDLSEFLIENIPRMSKLEDDLRKLLKI